MINMNNYQCRCKEKNTLFNFKIFMFILPFALFFKNNKIYKKVKTEKFDRGHVLYMCGVNIGKMMA